MFHLKLISKSSVMTLKMSNKTVIFNKYVQKYGVAGLDKDVPILFNITGKYRDELHTQPMREMCVMMVACSLTACFVSLYAAIAVACLFPAMNYLQGGYWFSQTFDEKFDDIGGYKVGVAIPTREEEGQREARNFEQTQDLQKLINKLDEKDIVYNNTEIIVQSAGSTSIQCI